MRPILDKSHDATCGPFSGSKRGLSENFSLESWGKRRDSPQVRRNVVRGISEAVSFTLQYLYDNCVHLLALIVEIWLSVVFHFLGMKLLRDHIVSSLTCFILHHQAWTENSTHSPGTSHWLHKVWRASGDSVKFGNCDNRGCQLRKNLG